MPVLISGPKDTLESLAAHCLAARDLIRTRDSPVMSRLIELLLFELCEELAGWDKEARQPALCEGSA